MRSMTGRLGKLVVCCGLVGAGWLAGQARPRVFADPPSPAKSVAIEDRDVVANVNGVTISRRELGEELIARKGKEQLQLLINRRIIEHACQKAGITVTDQEVTEDLKEVMKAAGMGTELQFEENILKQRKTSLYEYKTDVARPAIAMRKLARDRIKVTEEDIQKAFHASYGEKVRCLAIYSQDRNSLQRIFTEVRNDHEAFRREARQQVDPNLAAAGGITRINKHSAFDQVEKAAFSLRDGEVSSIIQLGQGWVILLREALEPADKTKKLEDVREMLRKDIEDKKIRREVPILFKELRKNALVQDHLNKKFDSKDAVGQATGKK